MLCMQEMGPDSEYGVVFTVVCLCNLWMIHEVVCSLENGRLKMKPKQNVDLGAI